MFWGKSKNTLEAPRSKSSSALDARNFEALPDVNDVIAAERAAAEAAEAEAVQNAPYAHRYPKDDEHQMAANTHDLLTETSEKAWNGFLRLEHLRYTSPQGELIGLACLALVALVVGVIVITNIGGIFGPLALGICYVAYMTQASEENATQDYTETPLDHIPAGRRVAIFFHSSFATADGTVRNIFIAGFTALALAIIAAIVN